MIPRYRRAPPESPEIAVVQAVWWHLKIVQNLTFRETFLSVLGWVWVTIW